MILTIQGWTDLWVGNTLVGKIPDNSPMILPTLVYVPHNNTSTHHPHTLQHHTRRTYSYDTLRTIAYVCATTKNEESADSEWNRLPNQLVPKPGHVRRQTNPITIHSHPDPKSGKTTQDSSRKQKAYYTILVPYTRRIRRLLSTSFPSCDITQSILLYSAALPGTSWRRWRAGTIWPCY